jgi:hypothetical protein
MKMPTYICTPIIRFSIAMISLSIPLLSTSALAKKVDHNAIARSSAIFTLKSDTTAKTQNNIIKTAHFYGATVRYRYNYALKGFSLYSTPQINKQLVNLFPEITHIEKNRVVRLMKQRITLQQDTAKKTGQSTPWGINAVGGGSNGKGLTAWLLDTGIDSQHADLEVNTKLGINFVSANPSFEDDNGHGTHIAGIIGAKNNNIDVIGVAAGATLVPVKVLDSKGEATIDTLLAGIDYVAKHAKPGDCANISLNTSGSSNSLALALKNTADNGIKFSIAAGNSAADVNNYTPANINHSNIYTVSAIDNNHQRASFANYGDSVIDYFAPGVNIESTQIGGGTTTYSGTSMAAPHICGLLILDRLTAASNTASVKTNYLP